VVACDRLHLLVGEDALSRDALFQLGMGSVVLNAAQKEELFVPRAVMARATRFRSVLRHDRRGMGIAVFAASRGMTSWRRGNSAKARLSRTGATAKSAFS
jgi:hypothetical protein